jgi:SAM-dependent methyltransferase
MLGGSTRQERRESVSLRIVVVDTYYHNFLRSVYTADPSLAQRSFSEQRRALLDRCFGTSDFYSSNLRVLGHDAEDIIANCEPLQRSWARERGLSWDSAVTKSQKKRRLLHVLRAQIQEARPDILFLQSLYWPGSEFLREIRSSVRLVIGQIASGLGPALDLSPYDLILTSFPHFVEQFRQMGGNSEYFRIGFGVGVLERLGDLQRPYPTVFVGTLGGNSGPHARGTRLLEYVASRVPVQFWGQGVQALDRDSPIRPAYQGQAWGIDMYRVLAQASIALNRHADWAEGYANNMRLYEVTGVGTMLLTDHKGNLTNLFEIGKEVVSYHSQYECVELLRHYLEHKAERLSIATAGQRRTLGEHTYQHRMQELLQIVDRYLRHPEQTTARRFRVSKHPKARPVASRWLLEVAKSSVRSTPFAAPARALWRRLQNRSADTYRAVERSTASQLATEGWQDPDIPDRQRERVDWELRRMYMGDVTAAFQVAAQAVKATKMEHWPIVEIGCASGYYCEVLEHLLGHRVDYTGVDYSQALVARARQEYPAVPFLIGDAARLPLANQSYAVAISGCVLLHMLDYARAIAETARVARHWCIFHRTPVIPDGQTAHMTKQAYAVPVVELAFGEPELLELFAESGLRVTGQFLVARYHLSALQRTVEMKTYVCAQKT